MIRYRVLQIRPSYQGDWLSFRFETRTPPGPWHPIDPGTDEGDELLNYLKAKILDKPELIGETLVFSGGVLAVMNSRDIASRPCTNFTQTFMF
ncbi:hypothetical protein [Desulfoluna spongiiphila]|uniref:hypothetical protein n=1 Tax=Desulfoluna spongiiphila TaxID=419481 RepID=UPI001253832A|nr:hypothetical protein [Desulfoluna spongiiphila]VVS92213.1 hypothetical protein DBB_17810 [Desulfoluna spongiiphila]